MEKKLDNYIIKTAYNYLTGYTDIEICDNFGEYRGTLNGSSYDFDDITDDDIEDALADGDYEYVTENPFWDEVY